jgi:hypothetical protein
MATVHTKGKKFAFIQDWGTYTNETLVIIGMDAEDMLRYVKQNGLNFSSGFSEKLRRAFKDTNASGRCVFDEGRSILWLPSWSNTWEDYDTLIHEIVHLIYRCLCCNKNMGDEDEAQAYQTEYLFRKIRLRLASKTKTRITNAKRHKK